MTQGVSYRALRHHAIRLQLDAVVALALHGGLRRGEIFGLHLDDVHPDNAYIVVWDGERLQSNWREVPFTEQMRGRVAAWIGLRVSLAPDHARPWLGLWASGTSTEPLARATFDKLLTNYLGSAWSFKRLRDTAGVNWLRAGMTIWELQKFLGHRALKDTIPYAEILDVSLDRRVERLESALSKRLPLPA